MRRVKCGEEKPKCLRCRRSGHKCNGYGSSRPFKTRPKKISHLLVPKNSEKKAASASSPHLRNRSHPTPLDPGSSQSRTSQQNSAELDASRPSDGHASAKNFKFIKPSPFPGRINDRWTCLLQAASASSPVINTALKILTHNASLITSAPLLEDAWLDEDSRSDTLQINRAVYLSRDIGGRLIKICCTFIACLLFHSFDSDDLRLGQHVSQDSREPDLTQVFSGLMKFREWIDTSFPGATCTSPAEQLRLASSAVIRGPVDRWYAEYDAAEELLRALEIRVLGFAEARAREKHATRWQSGQVIKMMPSLWPSLEEARIGLIDVLEGSMHWLRSILYPSSPKTGSSGISAPRYGAPSDASSTVGGPPLNPGFAPEIFRHHLRLSFLPNSSERAQMLYGHSCWDAAFRPLLNASRRSDAAQCEFMKASVLRMHWLASWIICNDACASTEKKGVDRWVIELGELLGIAVMLLREMDRPQYAADSAATAESEDIFADWITGLPCLVPLITVAWTYRHRKLRGLALRLLGCHQRGDHPSATYHTPRYHDMQLMAMAFAWLVHVEEESCQSVLCTDPESHGAERQFLGSTRAAKAEDAYIPEWAVARHVSLSYDTEARALRVKCFQVVGPLGSSGGRWRETMFPW